MRTFKALQTFESTDTRSVYTEGLSYSIVDGNRFLNACAEVWALQGKIEFDHIAPNSAKITGVGQSGTKVVDTGFWGLTKAGWRSLWQ